MKKIKKCKKCGKLIYPNQIYCSDCGDIILFGSKEKATAAKIAGFKLLFGDKYRSLK